MIFSNSCLYLLFDCRASSVKGGCTRTDFYIFHSPITERCSTLNLLKATKPLKGKVSHFQQVVCTQVLAVEFPYSGFFSNYMSFLGLAFPYIMSFLTEGDILRNKTTQITSLLNNPSKTEWKRTMKCQCKYRLKGWDSQKTEISICSKTYTPNFYAIISFGTSFQVPPLKDQLPLPLVSFDYFNISADIKKKKGN